LPTKLAVGTTAPTPSNELVLFPPSLEMTTTLLKAPAEPGVNITIKLVEPNPGRLNGVPERMLNPPPLTVATPLLKGALPVLVRSRLAWALVPTATVPKLRLVGVTVSCAGLNPEPVTVLVEAPPLLLNTITLL